MEVTPADFSNISITSGNTAISGISCAMSDKQTLTITNAIFANSSTYTVSIPSGTVQNATYKTINDAISWSFTTAAVTAGGTVTGQVSLDGLAAPKLGVVTVDVLDADGNKVATGNTVDSGSYSIPSVQTGTYTLKFKAVKYLVKKATAIFVSADVTTDAGKVSLKVGDVNGDNIIDLSDLGYLATAYGTRTGDALFDTRCDFNSDDIIDLSDLGWLASNYGLKGDN